MAVDPYGRPYVNPPTPSVRARPVNPNANPVPNVMMQPVPNYNPPVPNSPPMTPFLPSGGPQIELPPEPQQPPEGPPQGDSGIEDALRTISDFGRGSTQSNQEWETTKQLMAQTPELVTNALQGLFGGGQPPAPAIEQPMQLADWEGTQMLGPPDMRGPQFPSLGTSGPIVTSTITEPPAPVALPTPPAADLGADTRAPSRLADAEATEAATDAAATAVATGEGVPGDYQERYPNTRAEEVDWDLIKANWGEDYWDEFEAWAADFTVAHRNAAGGYPNGFPPWVGSMADPTENLLENIGALRFGQQFERENGRAPTDQEYQQAWYTNRFGLGQYNTSRYSGQAGHHLGAGWGRGFADRWGPEGWGEPWIKLLRGGGGKGGTPWPTNQNAARIPKPPLVKEGQ